MNKYKSDKWVKCADRLPKIEDDSVLVLFPNGSVETVHIEDYFCPVTNGISDTGKQLYTRFYISAGIEYWHPLPRRDKDIEDQTYVEHKRIFSG